MQVIPRICYSMSLKFSVCGAPRSLCKCGADLNLSISDSGSLSLFKLTLVMYVVLNVLYHPYPDALTLIAHLVL